MSSTEVHIDQYLGAAIRNRLEENYYRKINEQARLEEVFQEHSAGRQNTIAWYADHGVVHVQDVVQQVLKVLDVIPGILIPARSWQRVEGFMKTYGVILAYFHDIGLVDSSRFGRVMHPEFASQAVFSQPLDPLLEAIWAENKGWLVSRLVDLRTEGLLRQPPEIVLREMIALCVAHSKSKVSGELLNDPVALRNRMLLVLDSGLETLYRSQANGDRLPSGPHVSTDPRRLELGRYYQDFYSQAYDWLSSADARVQELVQDVIDTLRALRAADALRQRGTTLKTSGGYEVFASQLSGNAVMALRRGKGALYFVETDDLISAGEANLASVELNPRGDLRISFHLGNFSTPNATQRAARAAALVVNDVQADILGSFLPPGPDQPGRREMRILLENLEDNPDFVDCVIEDLIRLNPSTAARIVKVASLQSASAFERERYLQAPDLDWEDERIAKVLENLVRTGQKPLGENPRAAFEQVRCIRLKADEILVEAGTSSGFVYLPLGPDLKVYPLGGYQSFPVESWMPLGATGVIRSAVRNARVMADQEVELLVIPKEVYLQHWYKPYTMEELQQVFLPEADPGSQQEVTG